MRIIYSETEFLESSKTLFDRVGFRVTGDVIDAYLAFEESLKIGQPVVYARVGVTPQDDRKLLLEAQARTIAAAGITHYELAQASGVEIVFGMRTLRLTRNSTPEEHLSRAENLESATIKVLEDMMDVARTLSN